MTLLPIDVEGPVIRKPVATYTLIALNAIVYLFTTYQSGFMQISQHWIDKLSFIPILLLNPSQWYRLISSMFLHANIFHILFNMYFLYIFGREVESILGRWRYITLYIVGGLAASLFHVGFSSAIGLYNLLIPALGASGAISAVLGAALLLYPHRRMTVCWFIWFIPWCFNIRTVYLLLFWFATQVLYGYAVVSGTAFFAHVGGFVTGIVLLALLLPKHIRREEIKSIYNFFTGEYIIARKEGIGSTEKAIFIFLLVILLVDGSYSYVVTGYEKGNAYVYVIDAVYHGNEEADYANYISTNNIISHPRSEFPRIVWNRIYWAGLLKGKPNYNGTLIFNKVLHVSEYGIDIRLSLKSKAEYDKYRVLRYMEGHMVTDVIISRDNVVSLENNVPFDFHIEGYGPMKGVGSSLIQPSAILSVLIILLSKNRFISLKF